MHTYAPTSNYHSARESLVGSIQTHHHDAFAQHLKWPTDINALVQWIIDHSRLMPRLARLQSLEQQARSAATWARRSGACDSLIAAAVLHQLPFIDGQETRQAWLPMTWLRTLFPEAVLGPIRLLKMARQWHQAPAAIQPASFRNLPHAIRALKLAQFESAAKRHDTELPLLSWAALLPILHRASL